MKALGKNIFLDVDFYENNKAFIADQEIYIETNRDNTRRLRVMRGKAYAVPKKFADKYNIKEGDLLYCHHFLSEDTSKIDIDGKILCMISTDIVFFRLNPDGSIDAFNDYIIVKPVLEHESNYITPSGLMLKPNPEELKMVGDVLAVSPDISHRNLKKGDRIKFTPNSDYDIYINGEKVYKMRGSNLDVDYIFKNKEDCYDQKFE
jgi:co-chaperonin GroES (HSP10)